MTSGQACWSTGDVAPDKSLEYWNRLFADNLLRLEISSHALWNIDPLCVMELPLPGSAIADQLGGLLTLAVATSMPASAASPDLWQRVCNTMREVYFLNDVDPGLVATQVGISKRYLHKLFAAAGTTFRRELYDRRIAEGERLLKQPRGKRLSLTDIALASGFYDASHFARQFRLRYGISPGAYRTVLPYPISSASVFPPGSPVSSD